MGGYFRNQPPQQPDQPPQQPKQQPNIPSPIPPIGSPQRPNYDPNQPVEVPYEQYMGAPTPQAQVPGYRQPVQLPAWVPEWFPRDPVILGALGGGLTVAVFASFCLCLLVLLPGAATSRTNTATPPLTTTNVVIVTATPEGAVTATPPVGALINPFISTNMPGLTAIGIQLLDPSTGAYVAGPVISANSAEMDQFTTAFNITAGVVAPDPSCPNHLKFYIQRSDGSIIDFGACLKGVVILRGSAIQGLGTGDLPMGPFFTDVLYPLLPPVYQQLLAR